MVPSDVKAAPSYRGMLALVIILGVLIFVGVIALITTAVLRANTIRTTANAAYSATVPALGERIESTQLDGNRILLRLSGPNGDELVVLDAASGRTIGRIAVATRP